MNELFFFFMGAVVAFGLLVTNGNWAYLGVFACTKSERVNATEPPEFACVQYTKEGEPRHD